MNSLSQTTSWVYNINKHELYNIIKHIDAPHKIHINYPQIILFKYINKS